MSRQRVEHVQPAAAVAELEIADHDIRWPYPRLRDLHRLLAVLGGTDLATPAFHEDLDAFEDDRLVIDDQYAQPRHVQWLVGRSEEHTSELQSLMRISYAVFC